MVQAEVFPEPVDLALSLGCGFGGFERVMIALGLAKKVHAMDISPGAIEKARAAAAADAMGDKITYEVADLNEIMLPSDTYDAFYGIASVHHVFQLEHLFCQCSGALKPGALLLLDKYIGPSQFQLPPETAAVINQVLTLLPARYRINLFTKDGSTIDQFTPASVDFFERTDPSESIRSAEIVSTLKKYFDIVEFRPYRGALLHMLLSGIAGNFDETNEADATILSLLATVEELLERHKILTSDFAVIVARPL